MRPLENVDASPSAFGKLLVMLRAMGARSRALTSDGKIDSQEPGAPDRVCGSYNPIATWARRAVY